MCVSKLAIIGSDNPQTIIETNGGILLIRSLRITLKCYFFSEINTFAFKNCIWNCRLRNGDNEFAKDKLI